MKQFRHTRIIWEVQARVTQCYKTNRRYLHKVGEQRQCKMVVLILHFHIISLSHYLSFALFHSRIISLSHASRWFLEQETLHWMLSTGWFQERIRECFYKLIIFYTIKVNKFSINYASELNNVWLKVYLGWKFKTLSTLWSVILPFYYHFITILTIRWS